MFKIYHVIFISLLFISSLILSSCSSNENKLSTDDIKMLIKIESHYEKWKGTPYRYGGSTLSGIDCSALVMRFFKTQLSLSVPRTVAELAKLGDKVSHPQTGDLVFFKTGRGASGLHVGIYYAEGKFLNASTSKGVIYSSLNNTYWRKHYWMTRRLVDNE